MHVAGAEKNLEVLAKAKGFDAVLIEFEWFVVDGADEILAGARGGAKHGARFRIFLGLRKHEGGEFFAGERAMAVEKRAIEILGERSVAGVEGGESQIVTILKFFPIKIKFRGRGATRVTIP